MVPVTIPIMFDVDFLSYTIGTLVRRAFYLKLLVALSTPMFLTPKIFQIIEAYHDSEYTRKKNTTGNR